jgi:hypothetical protein
LCTSFATVTRKSCVLCAFSIALNFNQRVLFPSGAGGCALTPNGFLCGWNNASCLLWYLASLYSHEVLPSLFSLFIPVLAFPVTDNNSDVSRYRELQCVVNTSVTTSVSGSTYQSTSSSTSLSTSVWVNRRPYRHHQAPVWQRAWSGSSTIDIIKLQCDNGVLSGSMAKVKVWLMRVVGDQSLLILH